MCLEPPPSTRTVRPGPGWRHSLGSSWSDADTPVGKRPPAPQDSGSSPFSQPPCSTALLQTGAPSAACPEHPIIPTSEEPALHLHRHVQIIEQTSHSDIMAASALFNCHVMFNNKYVQQSSAYCQLFSSSTLLPVLVLLLLLKLHPHIVFNRSGTLPPPTGVEYEPWTHWFYLLLERVSIHPTQQMAVVSCCNHTLTRHPHV